MGNLKEIFLSGWENLSIAVPLLRLLTQPNKPPARPTRLAPRELSQILDKNNATITGSRIIDNTRIIEVE